MTDAQHLRTPSPAPVTDPRHIHQSTAALYTAVQRGESKHPRPATEPAQARITVRSVVAPPPPSELDAMENDDLDAIDKWLERRMGQLRQLEASLAHREQKLLSANAGMAKLLESLKHQVVQAEHARSAIAETHHEAVAWFDEATRAGESRMARVEATWADRIATLETVDSEVEQWIAEIQDRAQNLLNPVQQRLASAVDDLAEQVRVATSDCESKVRQQCEVTIQQMMREATSEAQQRLGATRDQTLAALEQLAQQAGEHRQSLRGDVDAMRQAAEQWADDFTQRLDQSLVELNAQLQQAVDGGLASARTSLQHEADTMQAALREQLAAIMNEASAGVGPLREQLSRDLTDQLETVHKQAVAAFDQRISAWRGSANSVSDELHAELNERLTQYREQADQLFSQVGGKVELRVASITREIAAAGEQRATELAKPIAERVESEIEAARDTSMQRMTEARNHARQSAARDIREVRQTMQRAIRAAANQRSELTTSANEAIEQADQHLRERIAQLRSDTKAMADMIEGQIGKRIEALQPQAESALEQVRQMVDQRAGSLSQHARSAVEPVVAALRRQVIDLESQVRDLSRPLVESSHTATPDSGEDARGALGDMLRDATALLNTLGERSMHAQQVAERLMDLTSEIAGLPAVDPDQDTVDMDAGTPLWLENAERLVHDLSSTMVAARQVAQQLGDAHGKVDHSVQAGMRIAEELTFLSDDLQRRMNQARRMQAQLSNDPTVAIPETDDADDDAAHDAEVGGSLVDAMAKANISEAPRQHDRVDLEQYAEDLRRRTEAARRAG